MVSHWLMKTEPEAFSIDDLARVKVEPWTGVRNYMARNLMRDRMQIGDEVLFYHSSCEPPGVAGFARVVRTGVVDATQFDPASKYFDPDSTTGAPRWICVDVEYVGHAPRFVPLAELRAHPALASMMLLQRGARLSVQPVSPEHHAIIVGLAGQPGPTERTAAAPPKPQARKVATQPQAREAAATPKARKAAPQPKPKPQARKAAPQPPARKAAAQPPARGAAPQPHARKAAPQPHARKAAATPKPKPQPKMQPKPKVSPRAPRPRRTG